MEDKGKEDVYEFKSSKDATPVRSKSASPDLKEKNVETKSDEGDEVLLGKRPNTDNEPDEGDDDAKRRKKDTKGSTQAGRGAGARGGSNSGKLQAHSAAKQSIPSTRSPATPSPKGDDAEDGEKLGPKVPPLKIVIPQSEPEQGNQRNGKNNTNRHTGLPYIVSSSSNDSEKDGSLSPSDPTIGMLSADDKGGQPQRVLRSHRADQSSPPATSLPTNSAPNSPGKTEGVGTNTTAETTTSSSAPSVEEPNVTTAPAAARVAKDVDSASPQRTSSTDEKAAEVSDPPPAPPPVDLHPRKRKLKHRNEVKEAASTPSGADGTDGSSVVGEPHPHDLPVNNCYQLYLDIRKQVERRRRSLFPVQPKPPQGFKDYLLNRGTYLLASNASQRQIPSSPVPANLPPGLKELFTDQERDRHRLRLQHVIEKEKLVLAVEQEILRVHGRAARALANQSVPFSVCTVLRDKEVYNLITPEQEEKDRNARSRYNGRLFLGWLQDVDDKWEKIKEHMLLRHHNEAESLHAVQKMDWEWKMVELALATPKSRPNIPDNHVPIVHVSDDFDLLPA